MRVGAVGVDLELDDLLAEVEQVEDVVAGLTGVGGQHEDAVVVLAEAELLGRADHPGGDVAVGLARGDLEAAGQHAAGEYDDHEVARLEVVGAADDALRLAGAVGVRDVDGAPVDGLAVLLRLGLHGEHAADDERSGDVVAGALERLELEAERGQPVGEVLGGDVGREVGVLADPGNGGLHQQVRSSERGGEADVALEHVAHVGDAVAEHQGAVDAHAEREAGVAVVVDAARGEHARVDHAAAAPLDPALALAGAAVVDGGVQAAADEAAQVDLGGGLGEGEVRRTEAGADPLAEHRRGEVVEGALEVGHGDALVDAESLDLVEHRAVRGVVLIGAEDATGRDDVDRRRAGQHRARLHRAGLGAQHEVVLGRLGPEGVLHGAGRVVGPEVEGVEVEPLGLDDRALGDLPAHRHEHVGDLLVHHRDRVAGALGGAVPREGDVDGLLDEHPRLGLDLELGLALGQGLVDRAARLADPLAGVLARLGRQRADLAVGQGQRGTVTRVLGADVLEGLEIGGRRDRGQRLRRASPRRAPRRAGSPGPGRTRSSGPTWTAFRVRRTDACAGQSRKCVVRRANGIRSSRIVQSVRTGSRRPPSGPFARTIRDSISGGRRRASGSRGGRRRSRSRRCGPRRRGRGRGRGRCTCPGRCRLGRRASRTW